MHAGLTLPPAGALFVSCADFIAQIDEFLHALVRRTCLDIGEYHVAWPILRRDSLEISAQFIA